MKKGRPTDSKKDAILKVRIDDRTKLMLEYCKETMKISKSEVVRISIEETYKKLFKE